MTFTPYPAPSFCHVFSDPICLPAPIHYSLSWAPWCRLLLYSLYPSFQLSLLVLKDGNAGVFKGVQARHPRNSANEDAVASYFNRSRGGIRGYVKSATLALDHHLPLSIQLLMSGRSHSHIFQRISIDRIRGREELA